MKQFIKKNWFKLGIIIILIILLGMVILCFKHYLKPQTKINSQKYLENHTIKNSINLQSTCANQAERALIIFEKENIGLPFANFSQINHYNQKMDKCFVYIKYNGPTYNKNNGEYWILKDAFENSDLAGCRYIPSDNLHPGSADTCFMAGGPAALSQEEIDDFINQRMEIVD